jgi:glutamate--cysteine ligase
MSRDQPENHAPIEDHEQLRELFSSASKGPSARLGVGTEHEKFGFLAADGRPVPYEGEHGIGVLLDRIGDRYGWNRIEDRGQLMALERGGAAITLEPGGQLELSGRVTHTVHETSDELLSHLREVAIVGRELGQIWTHLSLNPWDDLDQTPWMPKSRYQIMRRYLPTKGSLAHWMMKMTSTVQANYDFRDEADAMEIIRLSTTVAPLATAMFAFSPIRLGRPTGMHSFRMKVWEHTDPDRCGIPDFFLDPGASFDDYVNYLLDMPMFFVVRDGQYVDVSGRPFRALLEGKVEGLTARWGDWELHQSTAFPDTRLKQYIELRTCDAGPPSRLLAMPALFKGLFYDAEARSEAFALLPALDGPAARELSSVAANSGIEGEWSGISLREASTELVKIAERSLDRQAARDGHLTERGFLGALLDADGVATSGVARIQADWDECGQDRVAFAERWAIERFVATAE